MKSRELKTVVIRTVSVVDHGVGNIRSVTNALEYAGLKVALIKSPRELADADLVILPGVGNFGGVMQAIKDIGVHQSLGEYISGDQPFIGICVGMQVLLEGSTEAPSSRGFGHFEGFLHHLSTLDQGPVTPSIGWKKLRYTQEKTVNQRLNEAYFVHNYFATQLADSELISSYSWNGYEIPAHIARGRVHGVQFHPEKSRLEGVQFLSNLILELTK